MATCCQINRLVEARLDQRITNTIMHNFWWSSLLVMKKLENNGTRTLSIKKVLISKLQLNILMELTIHGSIMIQFPILTQHHSFSRKINEKKSDIKIDVVQNFSRFNRIMKHFRINLVMTNHMSTHEKNIITICSLSQNKQFHKWNRIGRNIISNQRKFSQLPQKSS